MGRLTMEINLIKQIKENATNYNWVKKIFKPSDAVYNFKDKTMVKYKNQMIDKDSEKILTNAWEHEHCLGCWQKISEDPSVGDHEGYVNNTNQWLCKDCYLKWESEGQNSR